MIAEYVDFYGGPLSEALQLETMDLHRWIKVARLTKNRKRLVDLENILSVNMKSQDITRMYDKIKHNAMTPSELDDEIKRSELAMGNLGKL